MMRLSSNLQLIMLLCASVMLSFAAISSSAIEAYPSDTYKAWSSDGEVEITTELVPPRREVHGGGKIIDISHTFRSTMPKWGSSEGLGQFLTIHDSDSMKNGSIANFSEMKLPIHTGTHVDAPGHVFDHYFDAGFDVDTLDLEVLNAVPYPFIMAFASFQTVVNAFAFIGVYPVLVMEFLRLQLGSFFIVQMFFIESGNRSSQTTFPLKRISQNLNYQRKVWINTNVLWLIILFSYFLSLSTAYAVTEYIGESQKISNTANIFNQSILNPNGAQPFLSYIPFRNPKHTLESSNPQSATMNKGVKMITERLQETVLEQDADDLKVVQFGDEFEEEEEEEVEIDLIGTIMLPGRLTAKTVERHIKNTWPFIPAGEVKVIELEKNIMVFTLKKASAVKKIFEGRPWSIDGNLVILHMYDPTGVYTELDWEHQEFWIWFRYLLPEHLNRKAVCEMAALMGEVIAVDPPEGLPETGDCFKVCVKLNITHPLIRGALAITAAKITKWYSYFYEKQPHRLCRECYVIKPHDAKQCKKNVALLNEIQDKPRRFGDVQKPKTVMITPTIPVHKPRRPAVKYTPFIPPKDGVRIVESIPLSQEVDMICEEPTRSGKRSRVTSNTIIEPDTQMHNPEGPNELPPMNNATKEVNKVFRRGGAAINAKGDQVAGKEGGQENLME